MLAAILVSAQLLDPVLPPSHGDDPWPLRAAHCVARLLVFSTPQLQVTAQGWVASRGHDPRATIELLVVPLPSRLAVVRRRMS